MHCAVFQSIVPFVCVQMASEVNQHKDALDRNVLLIVIVKLINDVNLGHAGIHAYKLVHAVLMHNAVWSIDKNNVHVHRDISEIQLLNVHLERVRAPEIHADQTQDVAMLTVVMNAHAVQVVLEIHTKDAYAENQAQFVHNKIADEMQPAELSTKMNPNVTALHFIQMETHIMNVNIAFENKLRTNI